MEMPGGGGQKPKECQNFQIMISHKNHFLSDAILELVSFYRSIMIHAAAPEVTPRGGLVTIQKNSVSAVPKERP
jgi:hypothetical protein